MAGNVMYILYTIILSIAFISIGLIIGFTKKTRLLLAYLIVSMPIVAIFQFYFWNLDFNHYIKSYVFSSKVFKCDSYHEERDNITIPLPKRTVLLGKEDACSAFYTTFVNDSGFISFYLEEFESMKNNGEITSYTYIERKDELVSETKGFVVELPSGKNVDLFIKKYTGYDRSFIDIDYKPDN